METISPKRDRWVLPALFIWTLINLIQAYFTGIHEDEAYYWVWSRFPDWCYFDHPPMTAFWIRAGYAWIPNELGVRIIFVLAHSATLYLAYLIAEKKYPILLFSLFFGSFLVHAGGFFAAPDIPLQFFSVLFLYLMKGYLVQDSWKTALLLGLIIPLLLWSKFHGILLILFSLLYAPGLMRRRSFWLIATLSLILFSPIVIWQFQHGFPTARYFLEERPLEQDSGFTTAGVYLGGVLILGGLLNGWKALWILISRRKPGGFPGYLRFISLGILAFFLVFSFRGHIELNWTALTVIPMVLFVSAQLGEKQRTRKWMVALSLVSGMILLYARVGIAFPQSSVFPWRTDEFTDWSETYAQAKSYAPGHPLMAKTYQIASKLSFYAHPEKEIVCPLGIAVRSNQYDIWQLERQYEGDTVIFLDGIHRWKSVPVSTPEMPEGWLRKVSNYVSFRGVELHAPPETLRAHPGDTVSVPLEILNLRPAHIRSSDSSAERSRLSYHLWRDDSFFVYIGVPVHFREDMLRSGSGILRIPAPDEKGEYQIIPAIHTRNLYWWEVGKPPFPVLLVE